MPTENGRRYLVTSGRIYRLVDLVELELETEPPLLRIEVFQDMEDSTRFRCRTWRPALLTGSQEEASDPEEGDGGESVAPVLVEWRVPGGMVDWEPFCADSKEEALKAVLEDLASYVREGPAEEV